MNIAKKKLEKEADKRISTEYSKALRRLEYLYTSSLQLMDFKTALAVQKEINEMLGIKQPVKHLLENKHIVEFIEQDENLTDEKTGNS